MLEPGNGKLGKNLGIWTFDLPPGEPQNNGTCPGCSKICRAICYGDYGMMVSGEALVVREQNKAAAMQSDFVETMVAEILENAANIEVIRWHSTGDFFSVKYIRKVHQIVVQLQNITTTQHVIHYAHTRSWNVGRLLPHLLDLRAEPNFFLWFSWDRSMRNAAQVRSEVGGRWCYLARTNANPPPWPCELVFRHPIYAPPGAPIYTPMPNGKMGGSKVCEHETGENPKQCWQCRYCFK